jgi:hypothetical protein
MEVRVFTVVEVVVGVQEPIPSATAVQVAEEATVLS